MDARRTQGTGPRGAVRCLVRRNEGRAHARGNALAFILIGKYNDRPPLPPRSEARVRTSGRTKEKGGGRLRTRVAAHLLRADSNCSPYLRTSTATL